MPSIVIGAGIEGLVAAATLARGGDSVIVLEQCEQPGGLCAGTTFHPGYRHAGNWLTADVLAPEVWSQLGLERHGLKRRSGARTLALGGGEHAWLDADGAAELGESEGWKRHQAKVNKAVAWAQQVLGSTAPELSASAPRWPLARPAVALRRMGARDMLELLRIGPTAVEDFLSEDLQHPLLRAGLALPALHGSWMGPLSPQSTALYLLRRTLAGDPVVGGPGAVVRALVAACASAGVEIQCGARVDRIEVDGTRVSGVTLADGRTLPADRVISTIGPRRTLSGLLSRAHQPLELARPLRNIRSRGTSCTLHLALSRPLTLGGQQGVSHAIVAANPLDIERSFDAVKHRRLPEHPVFELTVPTADDRSLAPEGHSVISLTTTVGGELDGGWSEETRKTIGVRVMEALAAVSDLQPEDVVALHLTTPLDIEAQWGHAGGHPMHAELALDQVWALRPCRDLAQHSTPVDGLFLGSTGTGPGLPTTGLSGLRAAQAATS